MEDVMEFISVREFNSAPRSTQETLDRDGKLILTNNGKPMALVFKLDGDTFEETLAAVQKLEYDRFVSRKLAEAEEYAKRPDAIRYSRSEFFEKARNELL
jgi:chloramphenicol O-acetyltransferase